MGRRLVEIDPETFYALEVDHKRLKREAEALKTYLLNLRSEDDTIGFRRLVVPICDAAIAGTLKVPLGVEQAPIFLTRVEDMGGVIPKGLEELYARFFNTATGSRAEVDNPLRKDGKLWAWMEFEE